MGPYGELYIRDLRMRMAMLRHYNWRPEPVPVPPVPRIRPLPLDETHMAFDDEYVHIEKLPVDLPLLRAGFIDGSVGVVDFLLALDRATAADLAAMAPERPQETILGRT